MKSIVVRYQAKPDRADENQELIEHVFAELARAAPTGFTYSAYRLDDGVSFIHIVNETDEEGDEPTTSLQDIDAFRAFTANVADRCDVQPVVSGASIVGAYIPGLIATD